MSITTDNTPLDNARQRATDMPAIERLHLTDSALAHIRQSIETEPGALGLRVGVNKSGCSGFGYLIDFAKEIGDNDIAFDFDGVTVVTDADSMPIIKGTEIDYVKEGLSRMLHFNNPNVEDSCGCGESFSVKGENV